MQTFNVSRQKFMGYKRINLSVHQAVHMTCKCNSSLMDEPILMKLYTVAVYNLRVYMKDNPGPNFFKGDNW